MEDGRKIKETVESEGWGVLIEPILDKMITDALGGKKDGRWLPGTEKISNYTSDQMLSYKDALIEFHNKIYDYMDYLPTWEAEYKQLLKENKEPEYTEPMGDTSYASKEGEE